MKQLSFNTWLAAQKSRPELAALAGAWEGRRGRLTRESVEKRAQTEYNFTPGAGYAAYDLFTSETSPDMGLSIPGTIRLGSELLSLDPTL